MRLLLVTLTALATFSSASASAVTLRAVAGTLNLNCGYPNGDCNSNGCDGFASADRITCTAGEFVGVSLPLFSVAEAYFTASGPQVESDSDMLHS